MVVQHGHGANRLLQYLRGGRVGDGDGVVVVMWHVVVQPGANRFVKYLRDGRVGGGCVVVVVVW